jgi:hypothetical protein
MSCVALVICGLVVLSAVEDTVAPKPSTAALAEYDRLKAVAGRDAEAQVKLALWCEAHGLSAERLKHLTLAVLRDPANASARGLMGLVAYGGRWARPDDVSRKVAEDPARARVVRDYLERRAETAETADAQWKLALWCEQNGLKAESVAHLRAVVRRDPNHEAAWKRLGYRRQAGRWVLPEQAATEVLEAEAQKKANRRWKPLLEKWRSWLSDRSPARRDEALAALDSVTDPRAVPMVWAVFGNGDAARQTAAARVLGRLEGQAASRALATLAVFGRDAEVRRAAAETLPRRDPREFADLLVGFLRDTIKYEIQPVGGPGTTGVLVVKNEKVNVRRLYSAPPPPQLLPGDLLGFDEQGLAVATRPLGTYQTPERTVDVDTVRRTAPDPGRAAAALRQAGFSPADSQRLARDAAANTTRALEPVLTPGDRQRLTVSETIAVQARIPIGQMALDANRAALVAQRQLETDVAAIDRYNAPIAETNARATAVLTTLAGKDLGEDRKAWAAWATDVQGYAFTPSKTPEETPTFVEQVPIAYQPQAAVSIGVGPIAISINIRRSQSCFGAGTLVRTLNGPRPIEKVEPGDQVLVQDPKTGALSYQAVVKAYHNPPNKTLRVALGGENVVVTGIHRFWKAGTGWVMARDLKPGDPVRTLGGTVTVSSVEDDAEQPVYNLEVARGSSFFVGRSGALVHDNSLVRPLTDPFDAPPTLAALAGQAE